MSDNADRLAGARLRSYVRTLRGIELDRSDGDSIPNDTANDATMAGHIVDGRATCIANDERGLGPALWWAASRGFSSLDVVVEAKSSGSSSTPNVSGESALAEEVSGHLRRRADLLEADISIWQADGPDLSPAAAIEAVSPPELPASHWAFAGVMSDAGARPVDDFGRLIAEVAGLEIARVVTSPEDGTVGLEVGVGQADRELQQYIHGGSSDDENLRRCVAAVSRDRRPGSGSHPLSRLVRQRWLRSVLFDDPGLLGLDDLDPLVPLRPSATVLRVDPAGAYSPSQNVVVVTSVGVDPDLLPEAVDYRQRVNPEAKLMIVLPPRDKDLATSRLIDLVPNVQVVSIDEPWAS